MNQTRVIQLFRLASLASAILFALIAIIFLVRGTLASFSETVPNPTFQAIALSEFQQTLIEEARVLAEQDTTVSDPTGFSDGVDSIAGQVTTLYDSIENSINTYARINEQPEVDGVLLERFFLTELITFNDDLYLAFLENLDTELAKLNANAAATEDAVVWHEFVEWFTSQHATRHAAEMARLTEAQIQHEREAEQAGRLWFMALLALAFALLFAQMLLVLRLQKTQS